jgi:hemoglobin
MRCAEAASDHIHIGRLRMELMRCLYSKKDMILDPMRIDTSDPQGLEAKVQKISQDTNVPVVYVVGGGAVFLAGREQHFGDATPAQQERCWRELGKLGFRRQRMLQVKSVGEAAAGQSQNAAAIQARAANGGAFVAGQRNVHGDPRTLYGRGGGVFGLAALADRLMDMWMTDESLNSNAMVARWHNSGQKEGFKFLVTQVMGYLTGGPMKYTGQPMDVAHKHLNISQDHWAKFMAIADRVFAEFNLESGTRKELRGILESFRTQCVVAPGEKVPEDKGLCRKPPTGNSLYAHAGGVYPLARFVDELIESACSRLKIVQNNTRTPAGLKYLVTELVCNAAGGPELVTLQNCEDAKLGVTAAEWTQFLELASYSAKTVWGQGSVSSSVVAILEDQRQQLCFSIVQDSNATLARRRVSEAGYNTVEVTCAMLQSEGDADGAISLLASGWRPEVQTLAATRKCPFSGAGSNSSASAVSVARCPFLNGTQGYNSTVPATPTNSTAAGATVSFNIAEKGAMAGRVLGSALQAKLDDLLVEPADLCCPITLCLFDVPVIASDGCSYERNSISPLAASGRQAQPHKRCSDKKFMPPRH